MCSLSFDRAWIGASAKKWGGGGGRGEEEKEITGEILVFRHFCNRPVCCDSLWQVVNHRQQAAPIRASVRGRTCVAKEQAMRASVSFSSSSLPPSPIFLRSPQFARGQNSANTSNSRYRREALASQATSSGPALSSLKSKAPLCNSQLSFFVFVCHFKPNCVSVACLKTSCVQLRAWPSDDKHSILFISSRSQFKFATLAEWTVSFSSCSAALGVHVFPDRVALLRLSHNITITEPFDFIQSVDV